jgi:hypothetical protein
MKTFWKTALATLALGSIFMIATSAAQLGKTPRSPLVCGGTGCQNDPAICDSPVCPYCVGNRCTATP